MYATKLLSRFHNNHLKAIPEKPHIFISSKKPLIFAIDGLPFLVASSYKELLGDKIRLRTMPCLKFSETLITPYAVYMSRFMAIEKRRTLMTAFRESQFNYSIGN